MGNYGADRLEFDEDEDFTKEDGCSRYRPAYNPDKVNERAVNEAIHGRRYKPYSKAQYFRDDAKYEKWLNTKSKRKVNV